MTSLELKIPPILIFLAAVLGIYNSPKQPEIYSFMAGYHTAIGIAFFCLGVFIGLLGVITFKRAKTTVNPVSIEQASSLVTNGIFKLTRNPMYLGMALGIIGAGIYLQTHWIMGLLFLFFFTSYLTRFQIAPEERMLEKLFGQAFTDYTQKTRRWI